MALLFATDFEDGTLGASLANGSSGWTDAWGATKPTYVASTRGALAMRASTGGTADFPSVSFQSSPLTDTMAIRVYVKMSTATTFYALQLQTTSAIRAILQINSNGSVRMRSNSAALGASAVGTGAINSSTWTRVEWLVTATTQQCRLFVGANAEGDVPDYDTGAISWTPAGTFHTANLGCVSTTAGVTVDYDDAAVDDTTWIGPALISAAAGPDSVTVADLPGYELAAARTIADAVATTDTPAAALTALRGPSDTAAVADAAQATRGAARSTADPVALTDAVLAVRATVRQIADAVAVTDLPGPQVLDIALGVSDPAGVTDSVAGMVAAARTIVDLAGASDSVTATIMAVDRVDTTDDPVGVADGTSTVATVGRSTADAAGAGDQVTVTLVSARTAGDPVGVADSVAAVLSASVVTADAAAVADGVTVTVTSARGLADAAGLTDAVLAILGGATPVDDQVGISDAVGVVRARLRSVADGAVIVDTVTATLIRAELPDTPPGRRLTVEYESRTVSVRPGRR